MTRPEQVEFVHNFCASMRDEIIKKIENAAIPEEWDGHELRELLSDKFSYETTRLMKKGRRKKDYKYTVHVNNL